MTPAQFNVLQFHGNMYVVHDDKIKYVFTANIPEFLFGLLPKKPTGDFTESDFHKLEWVRCENATLTRRCRLLLIQSPKSTVTLVAKPVNTFSMKQKVTLAFILLFILVGSTI